MSSSPSDPPAEPVAAEAVAPGALRRARPLDEADLDEVAAAIPTLPEPLAAVAAGVEVARADGDATGVRKRLFELGIAIVRYAVSLELGLVAEALAERRAPRPLAEALGRAARLSDGAWCALGRTAASQLEALLDAKLAAFAFLSRKPLAELVEARNQFVHGTGTGDDAPALLLALLRDAAVMLDWPVRVVASLDPPSFEERRGVPLRPGVWRKQRKELPAAAAAGTAYVVHDALGSPRWTPVAPFLPSTGRKLLLLDAPHTAGASWRSIDAEIGEHRESRELDAAIRALVGQDSAAPVAPTDRPSLVGRENVIAVMRRAAELVRGGGVSIVLLTGPQGVGRGRMLEVMREAAPAFGLSVVLEASCLEHRRGVLRPLRRALDATRSLQAVGEAMERAAAGDALGGAEALAAAVEAVEESLVLASLTEPILLLLDDAQWADDPTLRLLSLLTDRATRRARGRLLVVATSRDEPRPPPALTALIGQIERDVGAGATRVALTPLDERGARALVRAVAPLAPPLEERLVAGAAGLPFLLVQPVLAWAETGALAWRDGKWGPAHDGVVGEPVPGVAEVAEARLASSFEAGSDGEQTARHLLAVVGVAGAPLGVAEIERVTTRLGTPVIATERALEALIEAGLLATTGPRHDVTFAQPMVRQAVVEGLRRRPWFARIHRALLEVLGAEDVRGEDAAFIAAGYLELGDAGAAIPWLGRAIERALTMGLFHEAVEQADRLAAVAPNARERARAELDAVDALLRSGDAQGARERLRRSLASSVDDAASSVRARILAVSLAFALGEDASQRDGDLIADADVLGDLRLAIEARLAIAAGMRTERGIALVDEARTLLPRGELGDLRYRVLALRGELLYETRPLGDRDCREAIEQARDAAESLGSRWAILDAENDLAILAGASGDYDRALETLEQVSRKARDWSFGAEWRRARTNIAGFLLRAGRVSQAVSAARDAQAAARAAGDAFQLGASLSILAEAALRAGLLEEAASAIDDAVAIKLRASDPNIALALLRQCDVREQLGLLGPARASAAHALERARAVGHVDLTSRAELRLALLDLDAELTDAEARARSLLDALEACRASLRPPTVALLEKVRARLGANAAVP